MSRFAVLQPLTHDGKPYKRGEPIELSDDQATPLVRIKWVAPLAEKPAKSDEKKGGAAKS